MVPLDAVDVMSLVIIVFSLGVFYWFGRFTVKLIKQHYNIYPLLYELEESEKKKR
jgi:hypothetical protein